MLSISILLGACVTTAHGVGALDRVNELVGLLRSSGQSDIAMQTINKLQLLVQTSPSMKSLEAAMKAGVSEIEDEVETRIANEFEALQSAIDTQETELENQTRYYQQMWKGQTVPRDNDWFDCVAVEKNATFNLEQATEKYQDAVSEASELCKGKDKLDSWTTDFSAKNFKLTCDEKEGGCEASLQTYIGVLSDDRGQRQTSMKDAKEAYKAAATACEEANTRSEKALAIQVDASSTLTSQQATCSELETARREAMCLHGSAVMLACTEVSDYDELKKTNDATASAREEEWEAVHMTKCILTTGASVTPVGHDTLQACVDEAGKVRTLTYTDTSSHWCNSGATNITYIGKTWTRGDPPTSASFEVVDYAPNYPAGSKPFEFC